MILLFSAGYRALGASPGGLSGNWSGAMLDSSAGF